MRASKLMNIGVPLDGSELAARAVRYAARLARRDGCIHLVRVPDPSGAPGMSASEGEVELVRAAETELRLTIEQLEKEHIATEAHLGSGLPANVLQTVAREHSVDLIVMSTHGRGGLERVVFGSVAEAVLRVCDRPVLLISPQYAQAWEHPSSTVLIAVDGSALAEEALDVGAQLAARLQTGLTLLQVLEYPSPELYEGTVVLAGDPWNLGTLEQEAQAYLKRLARRFEPKQEPRVAVRFGHPASTIAQVARETDAGAIVMATHGLTGVPQMLLGSVTSGVVQRADVPVLVTTPAAIHRARGSDVVAARRLERMRLGLTQGEIEIVRRGLELVLATQQTNAQSEQISHLLSRLIQAERSASE